MPATISILEDDVFTVLRAFLLGILASGVEVVKGQENRVGEPEGDDYVVLTPLFRMRLSTNVTTYTDPGTNPGTRNSRAAFAFHIQLDVHGPNSGDNATVIATLFRDEYAVIQFNAENPNITPLYCDDPKQMAFINGENQYEDRWIITAVIQYNPVTQTPQDFADELDINIVSVDAAYPPGA
ncbi:hypothetical protein SAMN05445504_2374 [Burkholderia sp. CF099]|nr:hypothetical protein SAMN05445504_2374 [Burkholderia sp. CF099]